MRPFLTALGLALALSPAAQAAPAGAPQTAALVQMAMETDAHVTLIRNDGHKGHRKAERKHRQHAKRGHKRHRDNRRFGHRQERPDYRRPYYLYGRGDRVDRYVIIERPERYGLTRYRRYVQNDGYVYAVDPQTNTVIALIGLVNQFLR